MKTAVDSVRFAEKSVHDAVNSMCVAVDLVCAAVKSVHAGRGGCGFSCSADSVLQWHLPFDLCFVLI
jgi:hypothetical protein